MGRKRNTSKGPYFDIMFHKTFTHKTNGKSYEIIRADQAYIKQEHLQRITEICNEPDILRMVQLEHPGEKSFRLNDAKTMISNARADWKASRRFMFIILEPGGIPTGVIEIKSSDLSSAEIGYWNSKRNPGLITAALKYVLEAARLAGFQNFYAETESQNLPSIRILENNNFIKSETRKFAGRTILVYSTCG